MAITTLLFAACPAHAASPQERLIGSWYFKRGIAAPCDTLILSLEYHFGKDGSYSTSAKMKGGETYNYTGTYVATDTLATATVDGRKIGPFPYHINETGVLTIGQPDSHCSVELERE